VLDRRPVPVDLVIRLIEEEVRHQLLWTAILEAVIVGAILRLDDHESSLVIHNAMARSFEEVDAGISQMAEGKPDDCDVLLA